MSSNFVQSALLRNLGIATIRLKSRVKWWKQGPKVFLNSIPKAGTHLVIAELKRLGGVERSMLHVETRSVNNLAKAGQHASDFAINIPSFHRYARTIHNGQYFSAHLPWSIELSKYLSDNAFRTIFVIRDPRAILSSSLHYIMGLKRHHLHSFLTSLPDDEARYRALLLGSAASPSIPSMRKRLEDFSSWTSDSSILTLRFEDLVGVQGGGSVERKEAALARLTEHLELEGGAISELAQTRAGPTATLREGKTDTWRNSMPFSILSLMESECGDLCRAYGYFLD